LGNDKKKKTITQFLHDHHSHEVDPCGGRPHLMWVIIIYKLFFYHYSEQFKVAKWGNGYEGVQHD
jgi:hypothetical protein